MGKKSRDKGAQFEREVANLIGTERVGTRGKKDKGDADVVHPHYFIQCKRYAKIAACKWFDENAKGAGSKTPVLFMREDRGEVLVTFRYEDVAHLFTE